MWENTADKHWFCSQFNACGLSAKSAYTHNHCSPSSSWKPRLWMLPQHFGRPLFSVNNLSTQSVFFTNPATSLNPSLPPYALPPLMPPFLSSLHHPSVNSTPLCRAECGQKVLVFVQAGIPHISVSHHQHWAGPITSDQAVEGTPRQTSTEAHLERVFRTPSFYSPQWGGISCMWTELWTLTTH